MSNSPSNVQLLFVHKQRMGIYHVVKNVLRKPVLIGPLESDIVEVRDMSEKATENKVYSPSSSQLLFVHKQHMGICHVVKNVLRKPVLSESDIGKVRNMSEKATENKVYSIGNRRCKTPTFQVELHSSSCACVYNQKRCVLFINIVEYTLQIKISCAKTYFLCLPGTAKHSLVLQ